MDVLIFLNLCSSYKNSIKLYNIDVHTFDTNRNGHVTNLGDIINQIYLNKYDIIITEIGGTVGDIESLPYIESLRQMKWEMGENNVVAIHLTLIPYLSAAKELKTKPTQHSVKTLMESGVQADVLVCRTEHEISDSIRNKLARFCNVDTDCVIQSLDVKTIYDVPNHMLSEGLDKVVLK